MECGAVVQHIGHNFAVAEASVFVQPLNRRGFVQTVGADELERLSQGVVAAAFQMIIDPLQKLG